MLNCCILCSKVDNVPDSLKYAKQACEAFERDLGIQKKKKLPNFKTFGKTQEERDEVQKRLTSYSISLHMIGKSLKSLDKIDEGRTFIKRSLNVAENSLPLPNQRLVESIKEDLDEFDTEIRALPSKRRIEDPDTLLNKIVQSIIERKKIPGSSQSSRSQRNGSRKSSEK